jgi:hypothetical protein
MQKSRATKSCTVVPNICGCWVWNLPHIIIVAPRMLRVLLDFLENRCTPVLWKCRKYGSGCHGLSRNSLCWGCVCLENGSVIFIKILVSHIDRLERDIYYTGADTHNYLEGNYLMQLAIVVQHCFQTIHLHTEETPSSQRRFYTRQ